MKGQKAIVERNSLVVAFFYFMANRTVEELESTHPDYDELADDWQFFIRSYYGGSFYRNGNYLLQHPFESAENYERRKQIAYYYNYCKPIVDIFTSHLFRKSPERDYGSLTNNTLFQNFLSDANYEGDTFDQFMRDAERFASIYGRMTIVVDKPAVDTSTQLENEEMDIRPYCKMFSPDNVLDWSYVRLDTGREVLNEVKLAEGNNYRIWTRFGWELWAIEENGKDWNAVLIEEGEHDLGVVPVVNLYNFKTATRFIGVSDIDDIADINKNIYYLCSDAKEIIENTAFPMLALPMTKEEDIEVGTKNIIQFDPDVTGKPFWLEAPHSSLAEIREWVAQDIDQIHRIAKLGGVRASEDFAQARSGVALQLEQQQLHATLSEKADNVERAETQILDLWARWQGLTFDGVIDYPDEFSIADLDSELTRVIQSLSVKIQSKTFDKDRQKKVVKIILPKADEETLQTISDEIDTEVETTVETSLTDILGIDLEEGAEIVEDEEITNGDEEGQ